MRRFKLLSDLIARYVRVAGGYEPDGHATINMGRFTRTEMRGYRHIKLPYRELTSR